MSTSALQPPCTVREMSARQIEWGLHVCVFDSVTALDLWSHGCVCSVQHDARRRRRVGAALGWMSGAIVSDYDINSKIRARCVMRNEHGYNSLTGRSAIADVQTSVRGRPKSPRSTRPPHRNRADGPKRRPLVTSRSRPQRACRCPRRAERAALASWATPEHASSMASSTTSGNLTVYEPEEGDAGLPSSRAWY